jgi:hypothetical protein
MPTTIKSTELDFFEIKDTLKAFMRQQKEFEDYDFEGSALSNVLDVLAHNTHINAMVANFALNESYLTTAQLRNSVVTLAESLGYVPTSMNSAQSTITLTVNLAGVAGLDQSYSLLPGELSLRGAIDGLEFNFTNRETITANANGTGVYTFVPFARPENPLVVYEGEERTQKYIVDGSPNAVYTIPDENIDTSTVIIRVYDDQAIAKTGVGSYKLYSSVFEASTINELSKLYILRESPNKFFEITFGENNSLGETPIAGNVVEVNYLRTQGEDANGIANLRLAKTLTFGGYEVSASDVSVTTLTRSSGGSEREDIESIRKRAPFQYASQNRMVTPLDYEALILRKYSNFIEDIVVWGGEDDYRRDYGSVYVSIVWKSNLSSATIGELRQEIRELRSNFSIVSFQLKFEVPSETYLSTELYYQYNPSLSANGESVINNTVSNTVREYFGSNVGKFQQNFRRSNLLTEVDQTDPAVLSSRCDVKLQKRIFPILTLAESFEFEFPTTLKSPTDSSAPVIKSEIFTMNGKIVYIRNKLNDKVKVSPDGAVPIIFDRLPSTKLEVVDLDGNVVVSNIGSYNPATGNVIILNLKVQSFMSANNYIKLYGTPANESAIESNFNNVLLFDESESIVKPVLVTVRD